MLCKNMAELEKVLKAKIENALLVEVSETVRDVMFDHVMKDVYEVYEPRFYARRMEDNGLADPRNVAAAIIRDNTLLIENGTKANSLVYLKKRDKGEYAESTSSNADKFLTPIIEYGGLPPYEFAWETEAGAVCPPRPFMRNTYDELVEMGWHIKALKQGLKRQGLEVK